MARVLCEAGVIKVGLIILRLSGVYTFDGRDKIHVDHAGSISSSRKWESLVAADLLLPFSTRVWKISSFGGELQE